MESEHIVNKLKNSVLTNLTEIINNIRIDDDSQELMCQRFQCSVDDLRIKNCEEYKILLAFRGMRNSALAEYKTGLDRIHKKTVTMLDMEAKRFLEKEKPCLIDEKKILQKT